MNKIVTFKWKQLEGQTFPSGNIDKTGTVYDANYINKHYESLLKVASSDFKYICVTDDPKGISNEIETIPLWDKCKNLGGCYNRMYIFSKDMKELIGDEFVTMDIDTTFYDDFSFMFKPKTTTVHFGRVYHPGISFIKAGEFTDIWDSFYTKDMPINIAKSRLHYNGTDQAWFNYYLKEHNISVNKWTEEDGIYLMINLMRINKIPSNCKLISWAGPRDPYEPKPRWMNK